MRKYLVYECNPNNQFDFLSVCLYESDDLAEAHSFAYDQNKETGRAYVIFQPEQDASRGNYGLNTEDDSICTSESENSLPDSIEERKIDANKLKLVVNSLIDLAVASEEPIVLPAAIAAVKNNDPEDFYYSLGSPLQSLARNIISEHLVGSEDAKFLPDAYFLFEHYMFVENQIDSMIIRLEGNKNCGLKTETVIEALADNLVFNKPIDFTKYSNKDAIPEKYFVNQEQVLEFYQAIMEFYYGDPEPYFKCLEQISELMST